jgi:hypothetical protein
MKIELEGKELMKGPDSYYWEDRTITFSNVNPTVGNINLEEGFISMQIGSDHYRIPAEQVKKTLDLLLSME